MIDQAYSHRYMGRNTKMAHNKTSQHLYILTHPQTVSYSGKQEKQQLLCRGDFKQFRALLSMGVHAFLQSVQLLHEDNINSEALFSRLLSSVALKNIKKKKKERKKETEGKQTQKIQDSALTQTALRLGVRINIKL